MRLDKSFRHRFGRRAGNLRGIGHRILIVKDGKKYFLTNDAELNSAQVKRIYGVRQQIEEVISSLETRVRLGTLPRRISAITEGTFALRIVCFLSGSKQSDGRKEDDIRRQSELIPGANTNAKAVLAMLYRFCVISVIILGKFDTQIQVWSMVYFELSKVP